MFNRDLSGWTVTSLSTASKMFRGNYMFDAPLFPLSLNVLAPSGIDSMFENAERFNQDVNSWDVSGLASLDSVFKHAKNFNSTLADWNVVQVVSMASTFEVRASLRAQGAHSGAPARQHAIVPRPARRAHSRSNSRCRGQPRASRA